MVNLVILRSLFTTQL